MRSSFPSERSTKPSFFFSAEYTRYVLLFSYARTESTTEINMTNTAATDANTRFFIFRLTYGRIKIRNVIGMRKYSAKE